MNEIEDTRPLKYVVFFVITHEINQLPRDCIIDAFKNSRFSNIPRGKWKPWTTPRARKYWFISHRLIVTQMNYFFQIFGIISRQLKRGRSRIRGHFYRLSARRNILFGDRENTFKTVAQSNVRKLHKSVSKRNHRFRQRQFYFFSRTDSGDRS